MVYPHGQLSIRPRFGSTVTSGRKRQATKQGLEFAELSNGVAATEDPAALQAICDVTGWIRARSTLHCRRRSPGTLPEYQSPSGWRWECPFSVLDSSVVLVIFERDERLLRDDRIGDFLDQLAARVPAPGGGASAALSAAQAAALLSMVARYTSGGRYAEHAETVQAVLAESEAARDRAVRLAQDDAAAFAVVSGAYQLPKATPEEKAVRTAAIGRALYGAAQPPAATITTAGHLVGLAETLLPIGNKNVITDVAVAAELARAAVSCARVNVEINLAGLTDDDSRLPFLDVLAGVDELLARAEKVTAAVRETISR